MSRLLFVVRLLVLWLLLSRPLSPVLSVIGAVSATTAMIDVQIRASGLMFRFSDCWFRCKVQVTVV